MTLVEYVKEYYPLEEKIRELQNDPVKRVAEADPFPWDEILVHEGTLKKMIEVKPGEYIPVTDLVSYSASDIEQLGPGYEDIKKVYKAYMQRIDYSTVSIDDIIDMTKKYAETRKQEQVLKVKCIS